MKLLLLAGALAALAPTSLAQSTTQYLVQGTGAQVVPGPGAAAPRTMTVSVRVTADATGIQLLAAGFAGGVPDVTQVAIHGPATATTTGPVLHTLQFSQAAGSDFAAINSFIEILPSSTMTLIQAGETYLEVRTLAFPNGALRGAIHTNSTLCTATSDPAEPCGQCSCGNSPAVQTQGGCLNTQGTSAALTAVGVPAVSADSLDLQVIQASSNSVALLISGTSLLPLSSASCSPGTGVTGSLTDGLRCVGGQTMRHGVLATDANGSSLFGSSTQGSLLAANGFMAGQTRGFQVFYRDSITSLCGTGLNTSNAVLLQFVR